MNEEKFLIYKTEDNSVEINVRIEDDTVWLTLDQMAALFGKAKSTISEHIQNIFKEHELEKEFSTRKFGNSEFSNTKPTNLYNLDVIISVGYRVKSIRGTQFRQWATKRLNEYIRKGFTMDDKRLKELGGGDYFQELLDRIRDIRASEKVFYRQILDIYATSVDYDPKDNTSIAFFKKVQDKIHYAVHDQTAAETIYSRADAEKEFMGLTTFKGNKPTLRETEVAKNYLTEQEMQDMNMLVSGYLDFAERKAKRREYMTMKDWAKYLDNILTMNGDKLLENNGSISHKKAIEKAHSEYKKYQAKTLSTAEKDYLQTIRMLNENFNTKKHESKGKNESPTE